MGIYDDEFEGQGGSYVVGTDGKRVRVVEAGDVVVAADAAAAVVVDTPAAVDLPADATTQPVAEPTQLTEGDDHVV